MDLRLTDEQSELVATVGALYAKHASPEQVREAEPSGFDRSLWNQLQALGITAMAVDEAHGGWGASSLDLALLAEQHGRALGPAPVVEAAVAARLLSRVDAPQLDAVIAGERLVTVALHPAEDGRARALPAGAVADDALVLIDGDLVLVPLSGNVTSFENLGSAPLADVAVRVGEVMATGVDARRVHDAAVDDWLLLTAAVMVGIGSRSLEIGVDYVRDRQAFGVPIGSFQAISHRLADSATAVDGARLLTYEAAWAAEQEPTRVTELAALAFAFATETAREASYRALHFHGGYGFMMEYDIQMYWRRARGWAAVWGEPAAGYRRAAVARRVGR